MGESEIRVGDVVFCKVQPTNKYFAHLVLQIDLPPNDKSSLEPTYWIGNIEQHRNGWCQRRHIFGILVHVEKWCPRQNCWVARPLPRTLYPRVKKLVSSSDRWNRKAAQLCEIARGQLG